MFTTSYGMVAVNRVYPPCPRQYRTLLKRREQNFKRDLSLTVPPLSASLLQRKKELTFSSSPAIYGLVLKGHLRELKQLAVCSPS